MRVGAGVTVNSRSPLAVRTCGASFVVPALMLRDAATGA